MTTCEDPEFAAMDAYIRSQLAGAAEAYASDVDIDAKLKTVLEAAKEGNPEDTAVG